LVVNRVHGDLLAAHRLLRNSFLSPVSRGMNDGPPSGQIPADSDLLLRAGAICQKWCGNDMSLATAAKPFRWSIHIDPNSAKIYGFPWNMPKRPAPSFVFEMMGSAKVYGAQCHALRKKKQAILHPVVPRTSRSDKCCMGFLGKPEDGISIICQRTRHYPPRQR
jgi:hypothetical protein